jgi:hypothetical protein
MPIVSVNLEREYTFEQTRGAAIAAGLPDQSIEEIIDCWDVIQIWWDEMEDRFRKINQLRNHVPPDDPPDIELICAREIVPFERTRLQPYPIGQFENLKHEVCPSQCVSVPSISDPPKSRQEMLESMFNVLDPPWENVIDHWTVIRNNLEQTVRRKMPGLTGHGIIAVIDRVHDRNSALLGNIAHEMIDAATFHDFAPFTLILLTRWNFRQFHSSMIRRGEAVAVRSHG